jgi:hypothetical protein
MNINRNTNKEDLYKLFPLPSISIITRGIQDGLILKFKTFYLKIYDDEKDNSYVISGYRYGEQLPVFELDVHASKLREFASRFTMEDYLVTFHQPSENSFDNVFN